MHPVTEQLQAVRTFKVMCHTRSPESGAHVALTSQSIATESKAGESFKISNGAHLLVTREFGCDPVREIF